MNTKQQLATGATLTLGTLLLVYLYRKYNSSRTPSRPKPSTRSATRTLLSKYNPRPTAEDIQSDNNFQGRVVKTGQISEGGIVYHDIRYPREEGKEQNVPESTPTDVAVPGEVSSTSASITATLVTNDIPDKSDEDTGVSTSVQVVSVDETECFSPPVLAASVAAPVASSVAAPVASSAVSDADTPLTRIDDDSVDKTEKLNGKSQSQDQPSSEPQSQPLSEPESLPRYPSQSQSTSSSEHSHFDKPTSSKLSDKVTANGVTGGLVTTEEFVRNVVRLGKICFRIV